MPPLSLTAEATPLKTSGTWTFTPEQQPRGLLPLPDGSLVLLSDNGRRHELRRLHPPEPRVTETTSVPHADLLVRMRSEGHREGLELLEGWLDGLGAGFCHFRRRMRIKLVKAKITATVIVMRSRFFSTIADEPP